MATTSSDSRSATRDAQVLDSVLRLGLGVRELLRHALGIDPNNILQRLLARKSLRTVAHGLRDGRAYYVTPRQKDYGPQALQQRLAVAWHVQVNPGPFLVPLHRSELVELFGLQVPSGPHLLELGGDRVARVLKVYVPETVEVACGIARHLDVARSFPRVARAMEGERYGFLILVPWASGIAAPLEDLLSVRDGTPVTPVLQAQARKLQALAGQARFTVARAPTLETLTAALKEVGGQ